jgi:hypothetical protein
MKKTIFFSVFHAYVARNLLYGSLLRTFKDAGVRVVLVVPTEKKEHFQKLFGSDTLVEGVDEGVLKGSRTATLLARFAHLLIDTHYLWYRRAQRRQKSSWRGKVRYVLEQGFVRLFADRLSTRILYRYLYSRLITAPELAPLFSRYTPSLVFVSDLMNDLDSILILEAQKRGITAIGMTRSWDNLYSKGLMRIVPDRLLVNTHFLEEEAVSIHGVPADRIKVIGMPQLDESFRGTRMLRDEFMRSIHADPSKKLIVFAPGGNVLTDIDWQLCQILDEAVRSRAIKGDVHILVRNHPMHAADLSKFHNNGTFTVEYPGQRFSNNPKETELQPDETVHLADTLAHADVVIWVATTLGVDAAAFDKPQIVINFDGFETRPYIDSVKKYHDEDHMKKLIQTGGVKVANTKEDLVANINAYLENPSLDAEGRKRIVETQIVFTDGRSGERLERYLLDALDLR